MISEIDRLIQLMSKLPGLGPRSARRAVLEMIRRPEAQMRPLATALAQVADAIISCEVCSNLDTQSPCTLCQDPRRTPSQLCVVAEVSDLWALERSRAYKGQYHVLGGTLSPMEGRGPDQLSIDALVARVRTIAAGDSLEIIMALGATVEGQTTAHYVEDRLASFQPKITHLAQGLPVGGELDYIDEGTLTLAFRSRRAS